MLDFSPLGNARIVHNTLNLSKSKLIGRFNGTPRGTWYCAFKKETAIEEAVYHQRLKMYDSGEIGGDDDEVTFQELSARFVGLFHDARRLSVGKGVLGKKPEIAYPSGHKLARKVIREGGSGIIYPSVRKPKGTCLVAFYPQIIQNVKFGKCWKISLDGSPEYKVEEV